MEQRSALTLVSCMCPFAAGTALGFMHSKAFVA